ncbi:hypothetical protein GCM10011309_00400 [Litorimonas cladophorae]|uniref:L-threonylcarbamoyladenylate synthase n=1 Tax=Litorimonas cladophorae TaxID=1220491 RepID=A0A918NBG0_9PROT|nr:L-threonylcarbamoyladenylate synthase [Litorimonas cladophorae]GGX55701.1 hypothetical protein GCM10011309_00400 [Litorimonas cladophorae]
MTPSQSQWDTVCEALNTDKVVILPTETVYGLAARADSKLGVERIYEIKGRDFDKPLAVCVRDVEQAEQLAYFDDFARDLARQYWPGSLTIVLNASDDVQINPRALGAVNGTRTIALRCPDADWVDYLDLPIALTSANKSGEPDSVKFNQALASVGDRVAAGMAATGPLSGAPSTIVRIAEGRMTILRQGDLKLSGDDK